jgi:type I restriction enzyme R subunit
MPYNEAETRYYLIDPRLRAKGYDDASRIRLETPAPVDIEGPKGRRRTGPGRTDYALCVQATSRSSPGPCSTTPCAS